MGFKTLVQRERKQWLDAVRVFAMLLVILVHVSHVGWYDAPVDTASWKISNFYDAFSHICVPLFFMVSGACFLMPSRTLTVKQLFFKYILRIVTAYVFWCSLYYIVVEGAFRPNFSLSACKTLVFNVMTKPYSHLWFMPVIAGMYILLPILRQLAANRCTLLYFLAVTFFFSSICQPFFLHEKLTILANTATQWGPDVSIWLFYPMAGYYLATEDFSAKARKILYALGIAGLAVTILGTQWQSVLEGAPNGAFMSYDYPNVALAAGAVFVFIRYAWKQRDTVNFASKTVAFIAKYSFGAYLVHEFFNVILESRGIVAWELGALWATPFLTLGIAVASLAVSWLISKIPVIYRYIG